MLGVLALSHDEYHLAKTAFDKASLLHSPQTLIMKWHLEYVQRQLAHLSNSHAIFIWAGAIILVIVIYYFWCKVRKFLRLHG